MSKFIKLSNFIININHIHSIAIKPNKYSIHLVSNKFDGFKWDVGVFGLGNITSHNYEIEVCETKNSSDYKILSEWIDNN
jgi:hypothetical protein